MTGTMKVVPFQVSTWAALKAVLPCSTVARYTTRFSATPEKAMLSSSSNTADASAGRRRESVAAHHHFGFRNRRRTNLNRRIERAAAQGPGLPRTIAGAFQLKRLLAAAGASPPDSMEETCCRRWWW